MSPLADLAAEQRGDLAIASISGEIDASNRAWIATRLRAVVTNQSTALVIDLTGTSYLDSAGIALLFELGSELRAHQQQLRLVVTSGSPIARMISLTGLDAAVPVHTRLDVALAEL
jgi:anti-anti-sigma factor